MNTHVVADGSPLEVLNPQVLEQTYGAPMEVLIHGGMPVILEQGSSDVVRRLGGLA
jgi:ABC-type hemin transport system ATPase subunit